MRTQLSDKRIAIRQYREEDATALYEAACESANDVFPWAAWCHPDYTIEESRSFILRTMESWGTGAEFAFGVFDAASGLYLGGVGINQINRTHMFANLGYWVRSSRMGQGIASSATKLAADFALNDLGLSRVEIVVSVENRASQRVAEKAGALKEGVLRNRLILHNRTHDALMYSITPADSSEGSDEHKAGTPAKIR